MEAAEEEGGREGDVRKRVDRLLSSLHARFFGRVGIPIPFLPLRRRLHVVDDDLDAAAAEYYLLVVVGRGREGSIGHPSEWGVGCHGDVLTRRERGRRRKEERGRKMTGKQNGPLHKKINIALSLSSELKSLSRDVFPLLLFPIRIYHAQSLEARQARPGSGTVSVLGFVVVVDALFDLVDCRRRSSLVVVPPTTMPLLCPCCC